MLHIKNAKIIESSITFDDASSKLNIQLSKEDYFEGITLYVVINTNGQTVTLSCAELTTNDFWCKVDITKEMLSKSAKLYCVLQYMGKTQRTPEVPVVFKTKSILLSLENIKDKAYMAIRSELDTLKEQLRLLTGGGIHNVLPKDFDLSTITQGSVWTVIDSKGNCAFVQPFITNIEEVNGIRSIGRSITLTAKDISAGDMNLQVVADRVSEFNEIKARLETIEQHLFGDEGLR